jgi:hypothetical protein
VAVRVDKASARVEVQLCWAGGSRRAQVLARRVSRYDRQSDYPRRVGRVRALCAARLSAAELAARRNAEGFRPPKRTNRFTGAMGLRRTARRGITRRARHGSAAGRGRHAYRPSGRARQLGVSRDTVRRWLRSGWRTARRGADGHRVSWADGSELRRRRGLQRLPRTWEHKERLAERKKPKRRPAR